MKARSLLTALLVTAVLAPLAVAQPVVQPQTLPDDELRACGTQDLSAAELGATESALKAFRLQMGALAVGGQIKVAFHVIYSGSTGNIPQSQIDAQIAELNKAYSGFYGGANTGYTFVLASVSRTNSSKWFRMTPGSSAEINAKNALATDVPHRLNLYTCKPGQNLLGWSYFPQSYPEGNKIHGVVIHYGSVPGGYLAPYNLGGTADHEAGHYLGLYHTFQGGCTPPGDYVSDTPDEGTATSGCPGGKDTCPTAGLDPIHNYMDYSTDICYTEFTSGQDVRMDGIVPVYRPSLLNAPVAQAGSRPNATPDAGSPVLRPQVVSFRAAPNPFSDETALHLYLPQAQQVSVKVYNIAGQLVATLHDGPMDAGDQTVMFRAGNLPAGMYFTTLRAGREYRTRSVVLIP